MVCACVCVARGGPSEVPPKPAAKTSEKTPQSKLQPQPKPRHPLPPRRQEGKRTSATGARTEPGMFRDQAANSLMHVSMQRCQQGLVLLPVVSGLACFITKWAPEHDRRFPSAFWSRRQGCVPTSSTESETVAAHNALRQFVLPLLQLWDTICVGRKRIVFHDDNQALWPLCVVGATPRCGIWAVCTAFQSRGCMRSSDTT